MRLLLLCLSFLVASPAIAERRPCPEPPESEPVVYSDDFQRQYSLAELKPAYERMYESGKRLKGRAFYSESSRAYVLPHRTGLVRLDEAFLRSITRHVEVSLERRYADFLFFPDMGHSHLFIPSADYESLVRINPMNAMYEKMFAYRKLQILYHTAEKLTVREGETSKGPFPQDPILLWRYFSRNPVGDNNGGENVTVFFNLADPQRYNTVKDVPGHREYSAGFNISASKDGCFSFKTPEGKLQFFDISLEDLPCKNCGDDTT